jgi:hypothetical protein
LLTTRDQQQISSYNKATPPGKAASLTSPQKDENGIDRGQLVDMKKAEDEA